MDSSKRKRHQFGQGHDTVLAATSPSDFEARSEHDNSASTQDSVGPEPLAPERIALRAYEIFLSRGGGEGRDVEDWLQAEAELRAKAPRRAKLVS